MRHAWRARTTRWLPVAAICGSLALMIGCGTEEALSADSTCEDYLAQSSATRHDAAVRISTEIEDVPSPGNTMWGLSVDSACGPDPTRTLGEVFGHE